METLKMKAAFILGKLAKWVIQSRRPIVVGITGSIGKSSAKEAIALILARDFSVRSSPGNYNNEFGLPSAILGVSSPGRSFLGWFRALIEVCAILLRVRPFPQVLVLEMGIDRPGDMDRHLSIVVPTIAVLTHVSESHLAYFKNVEAIGREKGKLLAALDPRSGIAIINADNEWALREQTRTTAKIFTYGSLNHDADVFGDNIRLLQENGQLEGLSFKLNSDGKTIPVRLPHLLARQQLSAVLAAFAVGIAMKMNLIDMATTITQFQTLPGRFRLLNAEAGIRILDDTYNASRASTEAALNTLRQCIAPRKIVILGDMLEIGPTAREVHQSLRDAVIASGATIFVGVGQYMSALADALHGTNFPKRSIYHFPDPNIAREQIREYIRPGDLILVKGSQGLRMEFIVEALLGELGPEERVKLLCRQSAKWRNTPFRSPEEWQ